MKTSSYSISDTHVTIDLPGKFDSYFSGSSVGQGQTDGYEGGPALYAAYQKAERIQRGKGHALRLTIARADARAALDCLKDYAETCIVANGDRARDTTSDPADRFDALAEINAAKAVIHRIKVVTDWLEP